MGIEAYLGSERTGRFSPASCFAVATPSDITWQNKKFVGSAQKRYGSSILQHGSILIESQEKYLAEIFTESNDKPSRLVEKVTCLESILERNVDIGEVSEVLIKSFEQALNIKLLVSELSTEERELAVSLVEMYRQV